MLFLYILGIVWYEQMLSISVGLLFATLCKAIGSEESKNEGSTMSLHSLVLLLTFFLSDYHLLFLNSFYVIISNNMVIYHSEQTSLDRYSCWQANLFVRIISPWR